jgi:apolipoprotein N-acyltransferase
MQTERFARGRPMQNSSTNCGACSAKRLYLAALASGAMLYASFFPLNLGFLAWIALVPFLFLVRSPARPRHVYLAAFTCGLAFYVPAIQWMRVAHPAMYATWAILAIYSSLYMPLGVWLIRRLDYRGVPLSLTVPTVWVGLEYTRAHFPTGFPWLEPLGVMHHIGFGWYFLGYTQHDWAPLIQAADIAGVYGVSFLIVIANTAIYLWVSRALASQALRSEDSASRLTRSRAQPILGTVVAGGLIVASLVYGSVRLDHPDFELGPRIALLQSNLPQDVKMGDGDVVREHMAELLHEALHASPDVPDLVVWPETTCDAVWFDAEAGVDRDHLSTEWQKRINVSQLLAHSMVGRKVDRFYPEFELGFDVFAKATAGRSTNQLLGLNGLELDVDGKKWKYNSAKFIGKDGKPGPRYDKMHLVPFGEYVPLRNTFPWMRVFTPYESDYSCKPGEHWTRFPLTAGGETYHFGCIICYEDSDPSLPRRYALPSPEGPPVDFFVNISNDGWFRGTEEHEQHLAICRVRAIECRRAIVRAVNMGISGIIDGDGRIVTIPGPTWSESKKISAVVNGVVPIDHRESLYAQWGDWLPLTCWGVLAAAFVYVRFARRKKIAVVLDE